MTYSTTPSSTSPAERPLAPFLRRTVKRVLIAVSAVASLTAVSVAFNVFSLTRFIGFAVVAAFGAAFVIADFAGKLLQNQSLAELLPHIVPAKNASNGPLEKFILEYPLQAAILMRYIAAVCGQWAVDFYVSLCKQDAFGAFGSLTDNVTILALSFGIGACDYFTSESAERRGHVGRAIAVVGTFLFVAHLCVLGAPRTRVEFDRMEAYVSAPLTAESITHMRLDVMGDGPLKWLALGLGLAVIIAAGIELQKLPPVGGETSKNVVFYAAAGVTGVWLGPALFAGLEMLIRLLLILAMLIGMLIRVLFE
jgi:hypothetical protein